MVIKNFIIVVVLIAILIGLKLHCQITHKPIIRYHPKKNELIEAQHFAKAKKLDTQMCIIIQMNMHSGLKRGFIYNFNNQIRLDSFMVSHGCGENEWGNDNSKETPKFSNQDGSHLSSLGKYKIGDRGGSQWGIHVKYLLHGLENSNSNALKRTIVLHSWDDVTEKEVYPRGTAEGWGCPAVSNNTMYKLDSLLKRHPKMLLWIKDK